MLKYAVVIAGIFVIAACTPLATATAEEFEIVPTTVTPFPTLTPPATLTRKPASLTLAVETYSPVPLLTFPVTTAAVLIRPTSTPSPTRTNAPTEFPTATLAPPLNPTATATPTGTPSPSAVFCPHATPEPLWVEPVSSPTDQSSQVIVVRIGLGEEVTIETESGRFTVAGPFNAYTNPASVEITLLPNTVHHLRVTAKVRTITNLSGCTYGGYTLSTSVDRHGNPLTIMQGALSPP